MPAKVSDTIAPLLSVQDAIFPAHPFTGLLAIAREQNWHGPDLFPAFQQQKGGRISYLQAREGLLQARHHAGDEICIWSGARKSLPQLGQMARGMLAQQTILDALEFGLKYQLIAGSMVHLQFEAGSPYSALIAHSLFDDVELQDFLAVDHLLTAVNAARELCGSAFRLHQVELRGMSKISTALYEQMFACTVVTGADVSRVVIANDILQLPLKSPDLKIVQEAGAACEQELAAVGILGRQSLLRTLIDQHCELHSAEQMAQVLGISPRSLQRLLAREGTSYFQIIENIRIDRAKRLLQTDLSQELIAEQLGYSDARSFRRAFKRWTNLSPGEYHPLCKLSTFQT
ncbi:helix-turn-helix domain-containing protein [Undibacterium sp. Ji67W]|uniref:helix-turn-helix transcriptional regulator n=1 Tax=Undibacterium sp. Ji67W TaxID=3413042 RepID=UPI003BF23DBE